MSNADDGSMPRRAVRPGRERWAARLRARLCAWLCAAFAALVWAGLVPAVAQARQLAFVAHDQSAGLENLTVTALAEDASGHLWVGTDNGVYRYDGARFVRWGGAQLRGVSAMIVTRDGEVWAGNPFGLYAVREDHVVPVTREGAPIRVEARSNLAQLADGRVVVASVAGLLAVLPAQAGQWSVQPLQGARPRQGTTLDAVNRVHLGRSGTLWLGCGRALCRVKESAVDVWPLPPGDGDTRPIADILEDSRGDVWVRESARLWQWTGATPRFIDRTPPRTGNAPGLFLAPLAEDGQGRVLTQVQGGLARWDGLGWERVDGQQGLDAPDGANALLVDRRGGLWIGTTARGLVQWRGYRHLEAWMTRDGLGSDDVWSFARDRQGRLHIGTAAGVWRVGAQGGVEGGIEGGGPPMVAGSMALDGRGQLWTADFAGTLFRQRVGEHAPVQVARLPAIFHMFADRQGRVWLGTQLGLFVLDPDRHGAPRRADAELNPDPAHGPRVFSGCDAGPTGLWFLTDGGLWRSTGGRLSPVTLRPPPDRPLPAEYFDVIACTPDGGVWVASSDAPGVWQVQSRPDGWGVEQVLPRALERVLVFGLLKDRRGWLWVTSDAGVHVLDGRRWRSLHRDNGLVWDDCNQNALYEDRDGSIWVGTSRGAQHVRHPESLFDLGARAAPAIQLERGGLRVDPSQWSSLSWSGGPLTVRFDSPWFESRRADRFRYRLLGLDEGWTQTAVGEFTLSSLPPGDFRLEVVAENLDMPVQSAVATVAFRVMAPWWRTVPFYIAAAAAVLAAAAGLAQWRMRRAARREHALQALVAQRTAELEASREQLRELALRDGLTGLWNRRALMDRLPAELAGAVRDGQPLALLIVDADHFKRINDTHGHPAGDVVLKEIAHRLQRATRASDTVGRYGGEEFIVLLPGLDVHHAADRQRIETLHRAVSDEPVVLSDGTPLTVTCSIGVAAASGEPADHAESLIARADAALYRAKAQGRHRVVYS